MNKTRNLRSHSMGLTLIEALVALVIISVGVLAIARLQGDLVASSSASKARAEAIQLAESDIERLRSVSTAADFQDALDALDLDENGQKELEGSYATYTVTIALNEQTDADGQVRAVAPDVTITWDDRRDDQQTVQMGTFVVWDDPRVSFAATQTDDEDSDDGGGFVDRPTGEGAMGEDDDTPLDPDDADVETVERDEIDDLLDDGTEILVDTDSGQAQLVRDGEVLMTMQSSTGSGRDPDDNLLYFSTISGRVYIDKDYDLSGNNPNLVPEWTRVVSSDAAYCTRFRGDEIFVFDEEDKDLHNPIDPDNEDHLGKEGNAYYYDYQCYFAEGWYGNIGIVRYDGIGNHDRICVGSPEHNDPVEDLWDSKKPRLASARRYRGFYYDPLSLRVSAAGIGVNPSPDEGEPRYVPQHVPGHDFLLTEMTGQPSHADCGDAWEDVVTHDHYQADNPGINFCLLDLVGDGNLECMADGDPGTLEQTTIIAGALTSPSGPDDVSMDFAASDSECDVHPSENRYECRIFRDASQGQPAWSDTLELQLEAENEVCSISHNYQGEGSISIGYTLGTVTFNQVTEFGHIELDIDIDEEGCDL